MWKSVCCEARGRGHIRAGLPCQDKTSHQHRNGVSIIALADGAGSAKLSHFGAECLVAGLPVFVSEAFRELADNADDEEAKRLIMREAIRILDEKAVELGCGRDDLASTLLLAAVCGDEFLIIHIGDGIIGYLDGDTVEVASYPDNSEYANVTTFVTSANALDSMRLIKGTVGDICGFVLMSDGTGHGLYHKASRTLARAVVRLMHMTCLIDGAVLRAQLIESLNSTVIQKTQDDCSIAIIARPHGKLLVPFEELDTNDLAMLLGINAQCPRKRKRVSRYKYMVSILSTPKNIRQISLKMHIKRIKVKKHLDRLVSAGLITKQGGWYQKV